AVLAGSLEADRLYVMDRGYASYELYAEIVKAGSSLIGRVKDNTAFTVGEERSVPPIAQAPGGIRDVVFPGLGQPHHKRWLKRPMRLVVVRRRDRAGKDEELWLITDRLDLDADLIALAYRYRWTVELFFRWLKCILGARHLIAHSQNGITLQMYAA